MIAMAPVAMMITMDPKLFRARKRSSQLAAGANSFSAVCIESIETEHTSLALVRDGSALVRDRLVQQTKLGSLDQRSRVRSSSNKMAQDSSLVWAQSF